MGRQFVTIGYYLFAVLVGFGVFIAFFAFLFSLSDGFLSERNPSRAFWSATGGLGGVTVFLLLGRLFFGSYKHSGGARNYFLLRAVGDSGLRRNLESHLVKRPVRWRCVRDRA